jgi:hypothetical protein
MSVLALLASSVYGNVGTSGGLWCGSRDRRAELTAVAAGLLFGLLAQLAGEIGELVQCGIDAR